jgi:hypothetical protein
VGQALVGGLGLLVQRVDELLVHLLVVLVHVPEASPGIEKVKLFMFVGPFLVTLYNRLFDHGFLLGLESGV